MPETATETATETKKYRLEIRFPQTPGEMFAQQEPDLVSRFEATKKDMALMAKMYCFASWGGMRVNFEDGW